MTEGNVGGMTTHLGSEPERWTGQATGKSELLRLPKTGPVWMTGQGTRGLYCTLPKSPPLLENYRGAHAEALFDTHWRLQIAANLLHMAGQNTLNDVIRQATIYAFAKTPESVSDETVRRDPHGDLWRDWSEQVRSA